jgi:LuxR family maltose regulon positive regulatory protein
MVDRQRGEPLHRLAETKFHPPLLREDAIPRRLLDDLRRKLDSHALTLLSAPAGYGKTTLLAALPSTYPDLSVAWLSLDEADNDPVRFLTALIVALQRLEPSCGATAQTLLTGHIPAGAGVQRVTSVLINDVLDTFSEPLALVLDDLHRIREPSIFVALDYLLEHRPPHLHVIVSTRVDPPLALARLRARGSFQPPGSGAEDVSLGDGDSARANSHTLPGSHRPPRRRNFPRRAVSPQPLHHQSTTRQLRTFPTR